MAKKTYIEPRKGIRKYKLIQQRLDATLSYMQRRRYNGHVDWERWCRLYRGLQWSSNLGRQVNPSSDMPNETIVFNEVGTIIQQILPYLIKRMPKIKLRPARTEFVISALLQEITGNYAWREYKYQVGLKQCVLDLLTVGNMFMKQGYKLETDQTKKGVGNITYEDYVKVDAPFGHRISPFMMLIDQNAPHHTLDSARWCAVMNFNYPQDIIGNLSYNRQDVLDDIGNGKYKPHSVQSLIRATVPTLSWEDMPDGEDERWVSFDYWDKKHDEHIILMPGVPFPIHEEENPYKDVLEGFPIVHEKLIDIHNDMFGVGIPAWIEDPQYELNRHATKVFAHRRQNAGGQYNYVGVDEKEIEKHQRGESIVTQDPNSVTPVPVAPIPTDDWRTLELIRQAIRDYSRWSEFARTGALQDRASATQSNIVQGNLTVGVDFIVGIVDNFVMNNFRLLLQLIKGFWSGDRVIQIAGPMGDYWGMVTGNPPGPDGKWWVEYTREDIQGEFELEGIESTSAERWDPTTEKSQRMALLQTAAQLKPLMDAEGAPLKVSEVFKWALEAFEDKDTGRFFPLSNVIPAPMQTQTQLQAQQPGVAPLGAQQPALGAPPPGVPPQQQAVQQQAVAPESEMLGKLFGGLTKM